MFERTKVDNSRDLKATAASVELDDGRKLSGNFLISRSKTLIDVLNGPAQFVDFEPYDGEPQIVAKASIRSLQLIAAPGGRNPASIIQTADEFNPYELLGLTKGASRPEVRQAFHQRAMRYHPDRYSTAELPPEITRYLEAMARRINVAYDVLSEETTRVEAFAAQRTQPVYESGPTA